MAAKIITFEGIDGAGKSTLIGKIRLNGLAGLVVGFVVVNLFYTLK